MYSSISHSLSLFFLFFYLCNFPGIWTLFRGRRRAAVKLSLNLSLPMDDLGPMLKNEWTRRERKKRNMFPQQGCQMLHVLRTKKTIRVYFGGPWSGKCWYIYDHWEYFTTIGNILWPFGIFCGHQVVYFIALWYILWLFGILFPFLVSCNKKNLATQFHSLSLDFYIKLSSSIRLNFCIIMSVYWHLYKLACQLINWYKIFFLLTNQRICMYVLPTYTHIYPSASKCTFAYPSMLGIDSFRFILTLVHMYILQCTNNSQCMAFYVCTYILESTEVMY
jgi:hypothetical protein